jgi:hypothetical protein
VALSKKSILILIAFILLAVAVSAIVVIKQSGMVNQDFFLFWLAGKFALSGQNVYDMAAWDAGHTFYGSTWLNVPFYYPVYLSYLLIPLSSMNIYLAAILWLTATILIVGWAAWYISIRPQPGLAPLYIFVILAGCFAFRAVIVNIYYGQMDGPLFGLVLAAAWLLQTRRDRWAGAALALLLIKPNIGLPIAGVLLLYCLLRRNWQAILSFSLMAIFLLAASLILKPNWITDFIAIGIYRGDFVLNYTPTWWGQAANICAWTKPCAYYVGAAGSLLVVALGLGYLIRNFRTMDIWQVTSIAVFITLQITPYMWAYNQIYLLIPILMVALHLMRTRGLLVGSIFPLLISLISVLFIFIALQTGNDNLSYWLTVLVTLIWCALFIRPRVRAVEQHSQA